MLQIPVKWRYRRNQIPSVKTQWLRIGKKLKYLNALEYWYVQQNEAKANDANKVQSVRTFNVIINATDSGGEAQKMSPKMSPYDYGQIFAGLTSTAKSRTQNGIYILNLTA